MYDDKEGQLLSIDPFIACDRPHVFENSIRLALWRCVKLERRYRVKLPDSHILSSVSMILSYFQSPGR